MRVLAIYIVILFTNITSAQDFDLGKNNPNPNSVQLDIGSFDLFYSLHYERIILNRNKFSTAGRVGISYLRATFGTKHIYIPLEINEIYSLKNHHIEIGLGYIMNSDVSLVRNIGFTFKTRFLLAMGIV
jgi:hypothetical protein